MSMHQRGFLDFSAPRPDLRPFVENDSAISWQGAGGDGCACSDCGCDGELADGFHGSMVPAGAHDATMDVSEPPVPDELRAEDDMGLRFRLDGGRDCTDPSDCEQVCRDKEAELNREADPGETWTCSITEVVTTDFVTDEGEVSGQETTYLCNCTMLTAQVGTSVPGGSDDELPPDLMPPSTGGGDLDEPTSQALCLLFPWLTGCWHGGPPGRPSRPDCNDCKVYTGQRCTLSPQDPEARLTGWEYQLTCYSQPLFWRFEELDCEIVSGCEEGLSSPPPIGEPIYSYRFLGRHLGRP